ncbi:hypothetical protein [Janibacter limosus]|uniref:Restriction system protein Mrr-like N-terminal domain-containing protein n=1 Tax=Janibacter limosus TaxID=53458 RepID=A0A4P6MUH6_9MICO|nr:hypothetical protein [Janibacter limosus]QBF47364.1 hypothetical protein EXU32_14560 [Janibacter limosus]
MASNKDILKTWVVEALESEKHEMSVLEVAKFVWQHHEDDLRSSGDLFYSWQYDLRWAAQVLRDEGVLKSKDGKRSGGWELA